MGGPPAGSPPIKSTRVNYTLFFVVRAFGAGFSR